MNEPARFMGMLGAKIAWGGVLACVAMGCGEYTSSNTSDAPPLILPFGHDAMPFIRPGMRQPPTESTDEALLELDEPVIGVSVGSRHRAYGFTAMSTYDTKVINDVIGGVPVTVTFCDRTECARAFTKKDRSEPLTVQLGGWSGKAMLLSIEGVMFAQDSAEIPFDEVSVEKTTWGEWKTLHPDGDVFTGKTAPPTPEKPAE